MSEPTVNLDAKLHAYQQLTQAALELLAESGWFTFGHHADANPIPPLEFWGHDEAGDPIFERVREPHAPVSVNTSTGTSTVITVDRTRDNVITCTCMAQAPHQIGSEECVYERPGGDDIDDSP